MDEICLHKLDLGIVYMLTCLRLTISICKVNTSLLSFDTSLLLTRRKYCNVRQPADQSNVN